MSILWWRLKIEKIGCITKGKWRCGLKFSDAGPAGDGADFLWVNGSFGLIFLINIKACCECVCINNIQVENYICKNAENYFFVKTKQKTYKI